MNAVGQPPGPPTERLGWGGVVTEGASSRQNQPALFALVSRYAGSAGVPARIELRAPTTVAQLDFFRGCYVLRPLCGRGRPRSQQQPRFAD